MINKHKITQEAKNLYTLWRSQSTQPFSYHTADELWSDPEQPDVKAWEGFTASLPTYLLRSGFSATSSPSTIKKVLITLSGILLALLSAFGLWGDMVTEPANKPKQTDRDHTLSLLAHNNTPPVLPRFSQTTPPYAN